MDGYLHVLGRARVAVVLFFVVAIVAGTILAWQKGLISPSSSSLDENALDASQVHGKKTLLTRLQEVRVPGLSIEEKIQTAEQTEPVQTLTVEEKTRILGQEDAQ